MTETNLFTTTPFRRLLSILLTASTLLIPAFGQMPPNVTKNDWEEINFEFDSAVLVDGFPSLLRIAELLKGNPTFKVRLDGHADGLGSNSYNNALGLRRANTVKDFLVKYGASGGQVGATKGESAPEARPEKPFYSCTDEARWMNRRVSVTVLDGQGKTVSAGGAADAVVAMKDQVASGGMRDCCSDVLKRLDLLDEILKQLKALQDQNAAMKKDLEDLKAQHAAMVAPGGGAVAAAAAGAPGATSATGNNSQATSTVPPLPTRPTGFSGSPFANKFSLLGMNLGPDSNGRVTFTRSRKILRTYGR